MNSQHPLALQFSNRYGGQPRLFWAPGRVNLLGDHVDYCGGQVLPMPIQFGTTIALRLRDDDRLRGSSLNDGAVLDVQLTSPAVLPVGHWGSFLRGAIGVLAEAGISIAGVDVLVSGDIPGSGLSSSASLTVGLVYALSQAAGRPLAPLHLAQLAQRVEHEYVGVQCGLMDQAVIALAEPGCALWFDCLELKHRSIPVADGGPCVLVVDTGRDRKLIHSAYNARLEETRTAADLLGADHTALARLAPASFCAAQEAIEDPVVRRRARHVVSEGARVGAAAAALEGRDWTALGQLFTLSHASLRDDYEVSCAELDALAASFAAEPGCYGARMTGAGFGGSVVVLLEPDAVQSATSRVTSAYRSRFTLTPSWFVARSLGGVREIHD